MAVVLPGNDRCTGSLAGTPVPETVLRASEARFYPIGADPVQRKSKASLEWKREQRLRELIESDLPEMQRERRGVTY